MALVPRILKHFNLFVAGQGLAGLCEQVRLPDFRIKVEELRNAGMDGPIPMDMGMEKLDIGFTLSEHNPDIFRLFGLINQNAVQVFFRAALVDDTTVSPYIIEARGMYTEIRAGQVSEGAKNPLEAMIGCRYIKVSLNGEDLIEVDFQNFTRIIDGVDQLAEVRAALGL